LKGKPERVIKRLRLHAIRCGFALGARGKGISGLWLSFQKVIDWVLCEKGEKCFVPLGINKILIKFLLKNFILMDLLALKVTGHDVKRRIANQFSFVSLQQNSPFDVMSGNFKS
jgi:hypothetical protein